MISALCYGSGTTALTVEEAKVDTDLSNRIELFDAFGLSKDRGDWQKLDELGEVLVNHRAEIDDTLKGLDVGSVGVLAGRKACCRICRSAHTSGSITSSA